MWWAFCLTNLEDRGPPLRTQARWSAEGVGGGGRVREWWAFRAEHAERGGQDVTAAGPGPKPASVLAQVRFADVLVDQQCLAGVLQDDFADLEHIPVVGERQGRLRILFHQ